MTIYVPDAVLWTIVWVLVLWPMIGLCIWCWTGRRDVAAFLGLLGWFLIWGWAGCDFGPRMVSPWARRTYDGWRYLGVGAYETNGRGSLFVQLGPLCIGRKSKARQMVNPPPVEERTRPGEGQSWRWSGNTTKNE